MVVFALIVGCAKRPFEGWTPANTVCQGIYMTEHLVDWAQTKKIARSQNYYEMNPLMGKHPSQSTVDLYMGLSMFATLAISAMLTPKYRSTFQGFLLTIKTGLIIHNYQIGIRF